MRRETCLLLLLFLGGWKRVEEVEFEDGRVLTGAVGLASVSNDAFGQHADQSVKAKIINLTASVRTVMRSMCTLSPSHDRTVS